MSDNYRLELCQDHADALDLHALLTVSITKQECNQSHFDKHNCDFCKLEKEVERLRAELAEAKAASAVPVQVVFCEADYERTVTVRLWSNADAQRFADWINERMKERSEHDNGQNAGEGCGITNESLQKMRL